MSRFQDPYLAESVGFATGHSNGMSEGVAIGRQQGYSNGLNDGYTKGWNAAADEANSKLAKKDQDLENLNDKLNRKFNLMQKEIEKTNADREELSQLIFSLSERVKYLFEKNKELVHEIEKNSLTHEQETKNLQAIRENEKKAFLGAISIARAAMKVVASASAEEQSSFVTNYADIATELQTSKYINQHEFPHDQALIHPYIPDISHILENLVFPQVRAYRSNLHQESTTDKNQ